MPPRQGERRERVRRQSCVTLVAAPAWRRKILLAVVLVALLAGLASRCSSNSALGSAPSPGTVPTTTPSPQSSSAAAAARLLEPDGIAFWNRHQGLLVQTVNTPACRAGSSRCPGGQIDSTTDGGRTWTATDRVPVPLKAVATTPGGAAWVETGRCGGASPDACTSSLLLVSADGGRRWREVHSAESVASVSPVSPTAAWAVPASRDGNPTGPRQLVYTDDGGQRWQTEPSPCTQSRGPGTWAVDFTTPPESGGCSAQASRPPTCRPRRSASPPTPADPGDSERRHRPSPARQRSHRAPDACLWSAAFPASA